MSSRPIAALMEIFHIDAALTTGRVEPLSSVFLALHAKLP